MNNEGKTHNLHEWKQKRKYIYTSFFQGIQNLWDERFKALVIYFAISLAISGVDKLFSSVVPSKGFFWTLFSGLLPLLFVGGLILLVFTKGNFFHGLSIHDDFRRIGLKNRVGEVPILLNVFQDENNKNVQILEFKAFGIPMKDWLTLEEALETALNVYILYIEESSGKERIRIATIPASGALPDVVHWREEYLSNVDFELVIGEKAGGIEIINLAKVPHVLIGGSTGSGKTVMLKHLLFQSIKKGAEVWIVDFKGGVDFSQAWHGKAKIITEKDTLLITLDYIVNILQQRKELFLKTESANISDYNATTENPLKRIIFACDEVAEMLDKTGLSKKDKDLVWQIESKVASIARLGRAFGIHLLLATQRPDANVLSGQIKNNIGYKFCGQADLVLSQIILDNGDAHHKIPKTSRGRFLSQDGTLIQGYLFDENQL